MIVRDTRKPLTVNHKDEPCFVHLIYRINFSDPQLASIRDLDGVARRSIKQCPGLPRGSLICLKFRESRKTLSLIY